MHEAPAGQRQTRSAWRMPLSAEHYDQRVTLSEQEWEALASVATLRYLFRGNPPSTPLLARLTRPLQDAYELKQVKSTAGKYAAYLRAMYQHMAQTKKAFWGWSQQEWAAALQSCGSASSTGVPISMHVVAYLLCGVLIAGDRFSPALLAGIVFGKKLVMAQYERVAHIVFGKDGLGYVRSVHQEHHLFAAVTLAMLVNRSPYIDGLTGESLQAAKQLLVRNKKQRAEALGRVARALLHLDIVSTNALPNKFDAPVSSGWWGYLDPDVDPRWLAWVQAYVTQTNGIAESYRKSLFYYLIIAGRWLKRYHPAIATPDQWDEALAHAYVTWVCTATRGECVARDMYMTPHTTRAQAQPLHASSINGRLGALRRFFKALQKRPYQLQDQPARRLTLAWDPGEVLATPENIKRQLVPNPRNLDHGWWQKLTWAAASLSATNLSAQVAGIYPLAYYRAAGLLWVTGARRSDEIRRLKVGCVSREWAPEMRDEQGNQVEPEEDLAYLRVPVNKMQGEFWVPIPTYTADAIEAWERLRPKLQDPQLDRKEHKPTDYLFMTRNRLMGENFLNRSLIPLLCKVAGLTDEGSVPLRDTVGKITSHRARSTLATWLRNNGLSLIYIAKLLGHTDLKSLPWYLREDKHQFARMVRKHNPLERLVTAMLDPAALKHGTGEPAVFYYLGYGSGGRPHLCASPDYQTCIHQMHCTECEMHVDAEQAEVISRRPGVLTIEVHIPTPPLVAELLDQEEALGVEVTSHLPAPEVPGPAYHFNKHVLPRGSDPDLQQMKKELAALTTEWTEKAGKFDLRSAGMKSLKKRIADLTAKIVSRETRKSEIDPT
jgi:integrase